VNEVIADGSASGVAEFYDREYNPRLRIPDFNEYFRRWAIESRAAREDLACRLDLAYGPTAAERLDLFSGHGSGAHPLIMFLHGGYWRALDKSDFSWIARPYVARGISVAVVNYGLMPAVPLGSIVAQIRRACAWLFVNAELLGLDPRRIVGVGHSAGAHLLAMMLTSDWPSVDPRLPRRLFHAALGVSGLFDLEPLTRAPFLKDAMALAQGDVEALSPVHLRPLDPAPIWIAVGADETREFHRQARALESAWGAPAVAGVIEVPGSHHFSVCEALKREDDPLAAMLVKACIKPSVPV